MAAEREYTAKNIYTMSRSGKHDIGVHEVIRSASTKWHDVCVGVEMRVQMVHERVM